jgi:EpsI family protein
VSAAWTAAALLCAGIALTASARGQAAPPLRVPLEHALPARVGHLEARDGRLDAALANAAGADAWLLRAYVDGGTGIASLYVGYFATQARGRTIHSPRNCLPGSGWEVLAWRRASLPAGADRVAVNRVLLSRGRQRALVLYWYQGRGRVESSEYRVKWNLLRDAALRRRSEEALVRVTVPVRGSEAEAYRHAVRVAVAVVPALGTALPR